MKPLFAATALIGLMLAGAVHANAVDADAWMSFRPTGADEFFRTYDSMVEAAKKRNILHPQRYCYPDYCTTEFYWPDPNNVNALWLENITFDNGVTMQEFCFSRRPKERRCWYSDGGINDQTFDGAKWQYVNVIADRFPGKDAQPRDLPPPPERDANGTKL
jgi:hypothetical protein